MGERDLDFVMVPVPAPHVLEVMRFVTRLAADGPGASGRHWDADSVARVFAGASPQTRGLLSFLASNPGAELRPRDIGTALNLEPSDIAGIIGPLNRQLRRDGRRPLVESRPVATRAPNGKPVKRRCLVMNDEVARMVRAAETSAAAGGRTR